MRYFNGEAARLPRFDLYIITASVSSQQVTIFRLPVCVTSCFNVSLLSVSHCIQKHNQHVGIPIGFAIIRASAHFKSSSSDYKSGVRLVV